MTNKNLNTHSMTDMEENLETIEQSINNISVEENSKEEIESIEDLVGDTDCKDTAINEFLYIVYKEYKLERSKKQNFEIRAGFISIVLALFSIFVIRYVHLRELILAYTNAKQVLQLIKLVLGITIHVTILYTMLTIIKIISIRPHANLDVQSITYKNLLDKKMVGLVEIFLSYQEIIARHRRLNEERIIAYKEALKGLSLILIMVMTYIAII